MNDSERRHPPPLIANGLKWKSGDEVLVVDGDFPACVFPWLALRDRGVTVRLWKPVRGAVTAEELADQMTAATRLFCKTWVNSFTGYAIDLHAVGRICRNADVTFILNASQALGARVLDVTTTPVDVVTSCGHKWLCGPYGTGFCWMRPVVRESMERKHAYWFTMQAARGLDSMRDYTVRDDLGARTCDVFGTANFFNFKPWTASIEFLLSVGPGDVAAFDDELVTYLVDRLDPERYALVSPREGQERSTLVVIRPTSGDARKVYKALTTSGIHVALREGNLRLSPHLYNTREDLDRALAALKSSD